MAYLPPEIYRHIARYADGIDKIRLMNTNKAARNVLKIYKMNHKHMSHLISQEFINSEPMQYCCELNINNNTKITSIKHLHNLRILHCQSTNLSAADIDGSNIEILSCTRSKIDNIVPFTKLQKIDIDWPTYKKHHDRWFPALCQVTCITSPFLLIIALAAIIVTIIVYAFLLGPQVYIYQNYVVTNATLVNGPNTYDCNNCYKTWNDYPEGSSCSNVSVNILNSTGDKFCSLPGACYVYGKSCKKCHTVCQIYLKTPQCKITSELCIGLSKYSYNDSSGNIYDALLPVSYGTVLKDIINIFYDRQDPKQYVTTNDIRADYKDAFVSTLVIGITLFAVTCICIIICIISSCRYRFLFNANRKKIKQLNNV